MKTIIYILSLVFFLSLPCFTVGAAEKISCDDLSEITDNLDEVASAFREVGEIEEGDELDKALGEVIDAVIQIAEIENEESLSDSVSSLIDAYNDMDSQKFGLSIDSVIANLGRLYKRDCE